MAFMGGFFSRARTALSDVGDLGRGTVHRQVDVTALCHGLGQPFPDRLHEALPGWAIARGALGVLLGEADARGGRCQVGLDRQVLLGHWFAAANHFGRLLQRAHVLDRLDAPACALRHDLLLANHVACLIALRHPDVQQAAVYAGPDPSGVGDQVMAALVLRDGAVLTPPGLEEFLAAQGDLGSKSWPRWVRMCAALPQTPTNKVLKRQLAAEHLDTSDPVWERAERGTSYEVR